MYTHSSIPFGHYQPLDSWMHRLDARVKIIPVLLVMLLALLTESLLFYSIILVLLLLVLATTGVAPTTMMRSIRPVLLMVLVTALYHLIFTARDSKALMSIFGFALTEGGVVQAAFFSLRLLIFVTVAFLVTLTSSPSDLAEALVSLLKPLERIRVPVAELGLILFMAIRFIPILADEFTAIKHAQMVRGVSFEGSMLRRIRLSLALLLPVFVAAISRADDLAVAMEARGYRSDRPRSVFSQAAIGGPEIMFVVFSSATILMLYRWVG
jgi:energy-coupling factor transport system permease protein